MLPLEAELDWETAGMLLRICWVCPDPIEAKHHTRPVGRNFQRGVRRLGPVSFGAKSCNLAISRHFIQTFGKSCFPKLIFKDFKQLNKTSTLIVRISFQGGGGGA